MTPRIDFPPPVFVIDTSEPIQTAWAFPDYENIRANLNFGDYTMRGLENTLVVERKTLNDYVQSVTTNHDREFRKIDRADSVRAKVVYVVECDYGDIERGRYTSTANPAAVIGATLALIERGCPVEFCGSRASARAFCERLFLRKWQQMKAAAAAALRFT